MTFGTIQLTLPAACFAILIYALPVIVLAIASASVIGWMVVRNLSEED